MPGGFPSVSRIDLEEATARTPLRTLKRLWRSIAGPVPHSDVCTRLCPGPILCLQPFLHPHCRRCWTPQVSFCHARRPLCASWQHVPGLREGELEGGVPLQRTKSWPWLAFRGSGSQSFPLTRNAASSMLSNTCTQCYELFAGPVWNYGVCAALGNILGADSKATLKQGTCQQVTGPHPGASKIPSPACLQVDGLRARPFGGFIAKPPHLDHGRKPFVHSCHWSVLARSVVRYAFQVGNGVRRVNRAGLTRLSVSP